MISKLTRSKTVLAFVTAIATTSILPAQSSELERVGPPSVQVPVFFATDRQIITSNQEKSGATLSPLSVGYGNVLLPMNKDWQISGGELKKELQLQGWKLNATRATVKPFIEVRGYVAEPVPTEVLTEVGVKDDFWQMLQEQINSNGRNEVWVYIHGFASSGNNAVYSGGILASALQAPVVVFTWPSLGTAGLKPLRLVGRKRMRALYLADREMIDQPQVKKDLETFLMGIQKRIPTVKINLVAHSLGNRLMAKYLASAAEEKFDSVYFLAADIDQTLFFDALKKLKIKARYTSVFMNPDDRVLRISGANDLLDLKVSKKLGKAKFDVPGIEFFNYGAIAEPNSLEYLKVRHYVPFDQFASIVQRGTINSPNNNLVIVKTSEIVRNSLDGEK